MRVSVGKWVLSVTDLRAFLPILFLGLILTGSVTGYALDPKRSIQQYKHKSWTLEDDAPVPILDLAQDHRGFLWVSARDGLFRFDGLHFDHIPVEHDDASYKLAHKIFVAHNGDVWTWFGLPAPGRFAVYHNGVLRLLPQFDTQEEVDGFVQTADGAIWAGLIGEHILPLRYQNGRWERVGVSWGLRPEGFGVPFVSSDGALWFGSDHGVWRLASGTHHFDKVSRASGVYCSFGEDSERIVWCKDRQFARAVTGPGLKSIGGHQGLVIPFRNNTTGDRAIIDKDNNFWTGGSSGLFRIHPSARSENPDHPVFTSVISTFGSHSGLSSRAVEAVFQDREGSVWVGTTLGLDRFRSTDLVVEPAIDNPSDWGDVLGVGSDGAIYVAEADKVFRVLPGGSPTVFAKVAGHPEVLCEAPTGSVWLGNDKEFIEVAKDHIHHFSTPSEDIYDCAFDREGRMWITGSGPGLFRRSGSSWTTVVAPQSSSSHRHAMIVDLQARLVVLDPDRLRRLDGDGSTTLATLRDAPLQQMMTMLDTPGGILLAGRAGLVRIRDGQVAILPTERVPLLVNTTGLAQAGPDTWAIATAGAVRFKTRDLEHAFSVPSFIPPARAFSFSEGLPNGQAGYRSKNIVRGGDGRLWIDTWSGPVWLDPAQIGRDPPPPAVAITGLTTSSGSYRDPTAVDLPAGASSLQISFSVLNLRAPELARVRYQLEGQDRQWVDPGKRRVVYYTNLAPGHYRFRVIAANKDGDWNRAGASLDLTLAPTFLQSPVFAAMIVTLGVAALWLLYRMRIRSLTSQMRLRLNERLAERDRIARNLHDTLLQGFQGMILRFDALLRSLPAETADRPRLEHALDQAQGLLNEGRDGLYQIRTSDIRANLVASIRVLGEQLSLETGIEFRLVVEGSERTLQSIASVEAEQIAVEAMRNAFAHSAAQRVTVTIVFDDRAFELDISDDGKGIPASILEAGGRDRHLGMSTMRERAYAMKARFNVESAPGQGTRVTLRLQKGLAYERRRPAVWWRPKSILRGKAKLQ